MENGGSSEFSGLVPVTWNRWFSQLDSRLGRLVEAGEVLGAHVGVSRFRYLRCYALVLITRGSGIYEDEMGRQQSLVEGDWVCVLPELGHSYRPLVPGGWDEVYVMFEGPVFETWASNGMIGPDRLVGHVENLGDLLARLHRHVIRSEAPVIVRLCAFQTILAEVLAGAVVGDDGASGSPMWFADACRLLSRPEAKVKEVAAEVGLSYETFRKSFREFAGVAPHRYHRHQLINRAARMLESTDMKSADVAEALGFCDEPYFSRVFRQITGRTPSEHRRRLEPGTARKNH